MIELARGGLLIAVGMGFAMSASASSAFPVITVAVYDYEGIPRTTLLRAKDTAAEVFNTADIRLLWAEPFGSPPSVNVHILSRTMTERAKKNSDVLGLATVGSHMAYVLYPHVIHTARSFNLNVPRLLGYVIAHELGHLFLPDRGHAVAGLMRSTLNVRHGNYDLLYFTPLQATAIRAAIDNMGTK